MSDTFISALNRIVQVLDLVRYQPPAIQAAECADRADYERQEWRVSNGA